MLVPYTFSYYFSFVILLRMHTLYVLGFHLFFLDVNKKYFSNSGPGCSKAD